jgi:hypothetical protein
LRVALAGSANGMEQASDLVCYIIIFLTARFSRLGIINVPRKGTTAPARRRSGLRICAPISCSLRRHVLC